MDSLDSFAFPTCVCSPFNVNSRLLAAAMEMPPYSTCSATSTHLEQKQPRNNGRTSDSQIPGNRCAHQLHCEPAGIRRRDPVLPPDILPVNTNALKFGILQLLIPDILKGAFLNQ
jgi:hypothetical protein